MNNYKFLLDEMRKQLPIKDSFEIVERSVTVGGREGVMFFVDGLVKGSVMQMIMSDLMSITRMEMSRSKTADDFMQNSLTYLDSLVEGDVRKVIKHFYSGMVPLIIDGLDKVLVIDVREYPSRSIDEPAKEKSLRGSKDGFSETMMTNIALIRRRVRDNALICKNYVVGHQTKTDVALMYMRDTADSGIVAKLEKAIENIDRSDVSIGEQSIVDALQGGSKKGRFRKIIDPFPKVRYTERPDVAAAHLTEGKIIIIVDNSPSVIMLPVGVFDFMQDVDDYYFPFLTGNYFRFLRIANFIVILLLTPAYLLFTEGYIEAPRVIHFFIPDKDFAIPIFWQFILLEFAIDGLKLASLNTPETLGMSLSVIGALLLGEFSVSSGWFIPQTILCMAVVALASFTQPSIELSYAIKFIRLLMLIGVQLIGIPGAASALVLGLVVMATTRTLVGTSYMYPLIPFKWQSLKKLLFRTERSCGKG